jgi:hypothetical protein
MLPNDPPSGTKIVLLRDVQAPLRTLKAYESGELVRALQKWTGEDRPEDKFVIRIGSEEVTVRRDQISRGDKGTTSAM